jgi:hypothetical protein
MTRSRLSKNQRITIAVAVLIPLFAALIPMIYQRLTKPIIHISQIGVVCNDKSVGSIYLIFVRNTGSATATNLEIRVMASSAVKAALGNAPSDSSISVMPFAAEDVGLHILAIKLAALPSSAFFEIMLTAPPDSIVGSTVSGPPQSLLSPNLPFRVSEAWYDQGYERYSISDTPCATPSSGLQPQ